VSSLQSQRPNAGTRRRNLRLPEQRLGRMRRRGFEAVGSAPDHQISCRGPSKTGNRSAGSLWRSKVAIVELLTSTIVFSSLPCLIDIQGPSADKPGSFNSSR
jgi:hypothetical protein